LSQDLHVARLGRGSEDATGGGVPGSGVLWGLGKRQSGFTVHTKGNIPEIKPDAGLCAEDGSRKATASFFLQPGAAQAFKRLSV
jgi:hypothetical protein